ncbi:lysophospholipase [Inquilinus limosus]|uniref:alpha/beta fold hydrolase n=1 Tax=Inquilinus limosus TaxID=171674 RepID=UPI0003F9DD25|nr:alpha/beta fold hydrolase [Inquilinus limosus]
MGALNGTPGLEADAVIAADGYRLPLRHWGPVDKPRAVILALHGFNEYGKAFDDPARFWGQIGIATYAYDQRGFGATAGRGIWPGAETLADDAATALRLLEARYPGVPVYLLGESMGGAVAILTATRPEHPPMAGLILSAPATWGRQSMDAIPRVALWLTRRLIPAMTFTGRNLGVQASDNIPMLVALGRDPLYIRATRVDAIDGLVDLMGRASDAAAEIPEPTLVLLGEHEQVLAPASVDRLLRRLPRRPDVVVASYSRGWHWLLRDLGRRTPQRDIADWVLHPGPGLPSGAELRGQARRALADGTAPATEQQASTGR